MNEERVGNCLWHLWQNASRVILLVGLPGQQVSGCTFRAENPLYVPPVIIFLILLFFEECRPAAWALHWDLIWMGIAASLTWPGCAVPGKTLQLRVPRPLITWQTISTSDNRHMFKLVSMLLEGWPFQNFPTTSQLSMCYGPLKNKDGLLGIGRLAFFL